MVDFSVCTTYVHVCRELVEVIYMYMYMYHTCNYIRDLCTYMYMYMHMYYAYVYTYTYTCIYYRYMHMYKYKRSYNCAACTTYILNVYTFVFFFATILAGVLYTCIFMYISNVIYM